MLTIEKCEFPHGVGVVAKGHIVHDAVVGGWK